MVFSEKLTFLMRISGTSNKGLAEFLHVDPSRISQLKTGRRGRPRDPESLHSIATFFARHCTSNSQRIALSEGVGNITFPNEMTTEELARNIFCWLVDTPLQSQNSAVKTFAASDTKHAKEFLSADGQEQFVFYGNEGKRNAVRLMYQQALELDEPQTIYMCSEENPTWYYEDPSFLAEQEEQRLRLVKKGFHIIHILDLNTSLAVTFENIIRWIPAYMTGMVEPYFYPRIRDGVFNHTLIIIPGKMSLFSTSIANNPVSHMTLVSTNAHVLEETTTFILDYFNICIPAMKVYWTSEDTYRCITDLSFIQASRIQKRLSLPPYSLPMHILENYLKTPNDSYRTNFAHFYMDYMNRFESDLQLFENVEICPLATAEEVRSGKVRIEFPGIVKEAKEFYTPKTYALHLKNIIRLMETYEKFHFVPIPYNENDYASIFIKREKRAVLTNTKDGMITIETEQSDMVKIFQEYLLRHIDTTDFRSTTGRRQIIDRLRSLIAELTN